jgi:hypothetical protein
VKLVEALIDLTHAKTLQLHHGSAGGFAPSHLPVELLAVMTRVQFNNVPYEEAWLPR